MNVLDKDDKRSLAIFLYHNLVTHFQLKNIEAAEMAAAMIHKSNRSVWLWRINLIANDGVLNRVSIVEQEFYGKMSNLKKAVEHVQLHTSVKGVPRQP